MKTTDELEQAALQFLKGKYQNALSKNPDKIAAYFLETEAKLLSEFAQQQTTELQQRFEKLEKAFMEVVDDYSKYKFHPQAATMMSFFKLQWFERGGLE